jgi:hypothetical protein
MLTATVSSIELKAGQIGMFGYGSLLSRESMELTLGRPYSLPCMVCKLDGWQRSWNVLMPNSTFYEPSDSGEFVPANVIYLNVTERKGSATNGLLYVLDTNELEAFDRREWIYDRKNITSAVRAGRVRGGEVYTYVAKKEWLVDGTQSREWAAIRRSYLAIIERGLSELGGVFRDEYDASTDPIRWDLVFEDRKRPGSHPALAESPQGRGPNQFLSDPERPK